MKAAVIYENGGPDVLRYEDVPDPECPAGSVLIDVEAISIEGGDLLARAGSPPPTAPHIVGYLAAGTVVGVGAGVENPAVGDRVVTLNAAGSHASKRAVPPGLLGGFPTGWTRLPRRASRSRLGPPRSACSPPASLRPGKRP
jgi:NADPH:quinone reductase